MAGLHSGRYGPGESSRRTIPWENRELRYVFDCFPFDIVQQAKDLSEWYICFEKNVKFDGGRVCSVTTQFGVFVLSTFHRRVKLSFNHENCSEVLFF